jgi:hypothetical protein
MLIKFVKLLWKFIVENRGDSNFIESETEKNDTANSK